MRYDTEIMDRRTQPDPRAAFERAIASGRLSTDRYAANYAGHYMFMGPRADGMGDAFKHSTTRQALSL